jgi:hypothetical protein
VAACYPPGAAASSAERLQVRSFLSSAKDKDVGELVLSRGLRPPGLIRLVLPGYWPAKKAARLIEVLARAGTSAVGAMLVVEPTRTRLRRLP